MQSLFLSYELKVDKAYIIRVAGNENSENLAKRCAQSCSSVGMPYDFWDAYDGINGEIKPPKHHSQFMKMVRLMDHYMTKGEVACALSHISLWAKCVEQDQPLVVLEHDALMVKAYEFHSVYNSIAYLGGSEQAKKGWGVYPTPPHASEGPNKHFICRAHAYAIDPAVAKNMLSYVLKQGIVDPLDIMMRADLFPIHQVGIFAYDDPVETTTILNRPADGRTSKRNDKLEV